jgi:chromate transporter, chromate ion transporter (CHR) family
VRSYIKNNNEIAISPSQRPSLALLFTSFFGLGMTSFGGPAMTVYIRRMAVEQKKWFDDPTFLAGVALCQAIPGATAMQVAAYVGLRTRGVAGSAATYIGFGLPAFLIMISLSALYVRTHNLPIVVSLFSGLQAIIVAIIANAAVSFGRNYLKVRKDLMIAAFAAGMFILKVNPILVILLSALIGLIAYRDQHFQQKSVSSVETPKTIRPLIFILSAAATGFVLLLILQRNIFDMAVMMLRIDLFAFGGGFASVPLMLHEFVEVRSWMDSSTFMNGIALGQITPGPIVITATFVGYILYGPLGAVIATVSILLPSFLMIIGAVPYYDRFSSFPWFNRAISGIFCSFVGLLASAAFHFALSMPSDVFHVVTAIASFVALLYRVEIRWVVLIGAVISVILGIKAI